MEVSKEWENLEERLRRLEENDWFREDSLKNLDQLLQEQQRQIDALERQLTTLNSQLQSLKEFANILTTDSNQSSQELPPHYQTNNWHGNNN